MFFGASHWYPHKEPDAMTAVQWAAIAPKINGQPIYSEELNAFISPGSFVLVERARNDSEDGSDDDSDDELCWILEGVGNAPRIVGSQQVRVNVFAPTSHYVQLTHPSVKHMQEVQQRAR